MGGSSSKKEFGKWRAILWPIYGFELKKLIPMGLLFFFILFNYTVLRDTKDTLVVTAARGSQVIPFLKFWGVLPCAVVLMLIYAKLSNRLSKPALFYSMVVPFLCFFGLFWLVLYPCRDYLHPTAFCDNMQMVLPAGFRGMIDVIRNWTFSLFYIMSELWGSMAISLLFWGFANDITKMSESKRFYTIFSMFANLALIFSGRFIRWSSLLRNGLPQGVDQWQVTLNYTMSAVTIAGLLVLGIYWWINKYVLSDARLYSADGEIGNSSGSGNSKKPKLSLKNSFAMLLRSKYLGCIAILVIAYGVSISLVEVTWKDQLHHRYPSEHEYQHFMGWFSEITGWITITITFIFGGGIVRALGWTKTALITPILLLSTGIAFFSFIIFRGALLPVVSLLNSTHLVMAVVIGATQNIASKASKYSFFDPTKEMAYIPLNQDEKVKGKAAVDVVCARFGKSGGSLIQQSLFLMLNVPVVSAIAPIVAVVLVAIILIWIVAVCALGKMFNELTSSDRTTTSEFTSKRGEAIPASTRT